MREENRPAGSKKKKKRRLRASRSFGNKGARITAFAHSVSLFHRFFPSLSFFISRLPTFSIEFICRSHLGRGTCIMDGSRVPGPALLPSRVSLGSASRPT